MTTKIKQTVPKNSLTMRQLQSFTRDKMAVVGLFGMLIIILLCICAPLLTSYNPARIDLAQASLPMSKEHPLGTDTMGRDVWARLLYGGRWSLIIGVTASITVNVLGAILGCVAGFFGGIVDQVIVTIQEYLSFFPQMLTILLFTSMFEPSILMLIVIWTVTGWGGTMRIVRGKIVSLKNEPFVESCRANGIGSASIMFHHMIPNTLGTIVVNLAGGISGYILQEAALAYLGLGLPKSIPTWGNIINEAKRLDIVQMYPVLWLAPGLAISIFTLCASFFANGLRDAVDPTSR